MGGDKGDDTRGFVAALRSLGLTPHVAQNTTRRASAIDGRTTRHAGYTVSQQKRKRVEEVFGWVKTVALLRKTRHCGRAPSRVAVRPGRGAVQPGADPQRDRGEGDEITDRRGARADGRPPRQGGEGLFRPARLVLGVVRSLVSPRLSAARRCKTVTRPLPRSRRPQQAHFQGSRSLASAAGRPGKGQSGPGGRTRGDVSENRLPRVGGQTGSWLFFFFFFFFFFYNNTGFKWRRLRPPAPSAAEQAPHQRGARSPRPESAAGRCSADRPGPGSQTPGAGAGPRASGAEPAPAPPARQAGDGFGTMADLRRAIFFRSP